MSNPKKDRACAIAGTLLFHAIAVLVLFLMAFRAPYPPPGEEGVEVDLGLYNQGMGLVQPQTSAIPERSVPPRPEADQNTRSKDDIVTQDSEETPTVQTEQHQNHQEPSPARPRENTQPPEETPQPTVNQRALFRGADRPQEGGSEGITGQPGDQGNPNGMTGVRQYQGQGGQGNGLGYDLGGRGAKSLQRPPRDFPEEGHIVVEIIVNREGEVIRASIARGTDIINTEMRNLALDAARRSTFAPDPNAAEEQRGTITYTFVQNQ